jgi:hypothetical protein
MSEGKKKAQFIIRLSLFALLDDAILNHYIIILTTPINILRLILTSLKKIRWRSRVGQSPFYIDA